MPQWTRGAPALPFYYVRLRHGQANFARFEAATSGLNGAGVQDLDAAAAAITASIRPQAVGRWVLAALGPCPAARVRAAGAPAAAVLGVRQALERGRGSRAVPVGTALAGTILAVAGLCATAVLGASLSRLTASPELYGDPFQAFFNWSGPGGAAGTGLLTGLERDPAIDRITLVSAAAITVNRASVQALAAAALRGPLLLSAADGRLPGGRGEIALGASTMRQARAHVGSVVQVGVTSPDGTARSARFRVVGLASFPSDFGTGGLGTGRR